MFHLIGQAIFGLVVGLIARFLLPGKDPMGLLMTALIGMVGSLLGTGVGRLIWKNKEYKAHWIMSILGAIVVLGAFRFLR